MVNTFMPYPDLGKSAASLDRLRLGKQRAEAVQVLKALLDPNYGWQHHPAVKMWQGYEGLLVRYGIAVCNEWRSRGYKDNTLNFFMNQGRYLVPCEVPWWIGDPLFHRTHQSNLIRKFPEHYVKQFPGVPPNLPYYWPPAEMD